jgi:predicted aldo/keto reductase-like oxidoreductase
MSKSNMDRRRFLTTGVVGCLGAGALAGSDALGQAEVDPDLDFEMKEEDGPRIRKYNILGGTGLKVSDISLGISQEQAVMHYAFDRGINFFDSAEAYYNGQHETELGRAFSKMRDKVVITTKHVFGNLGAIKKQDVIDRFDQSLERLQTDYVDIAMMHEIRDPAILEHEEILGAYEALKKAGKYRFLGFSTHDSARICPLAIKSKLFSAMMVYYNSVQYPERFEILAEAQKAGVGVIAMKTMAGREQDKVAALAKERTTYMKAAVKWALADPNVNSAVVTMGTFEHVDECLRASGQAPTPREQASLDVYREVAVNRYCRMGCAKCLAACPAGVAIPDVMRFGMYYENYGIEKYAIQQYAGLDGTKRASACVGCDGACESACPHGLAISERLARYDGLLRI